MALFARKGGTLHLAAGKVFVAGMLAISAAAAGAGPLLPRIATKMGTALRLLRRP